MGWSTALTERDWIFALVGQAELFTRWRGWSGQLVHFSGGWVHLGPPFQVVYASTVIAWASAQTVQTTEETHLGAG